MTIRLRTAALLLAVLLAIVAAGFAARATKPTVSAWTNPAVFSATATAGTWTVPSTSKCEVREQATDAVVPGSTCTIQFKSQNFWGAAGSGNGQANFNLLGSSGTNTQYMYFEIALGNYLTPPGWWNWANARISTFSQGTITSPCSALPQVTGRKNANMGATVNVYLEFKDFPVTPQYCS
ncbi:hypothetical protein GCM10010401_06830 [Rarobacter faecitabidus]|uniref:Secreted protein n=1 Tax=Rarobacter faecitabidus TaxID=13243 RepID=A0A542ZTH6_RARFA|nr:hypothetical protein [Rarobacter faecitabidus]TQL63569.1 hypothetical protein FB461_0030 [Rarobacter faecitabidus]